MRLAAENGKAIPNYVALTESVVRRLRPRPGARSTTFHDLKQPGLMLVLTARGAASYYFLRRMENGRVAKLKIGDPARMSVEQARRRAQELHHLANTGTDLIRERQHRRETVATGITLGELWTRFEDEWMKARMRPHTVKVFTSLWRTCLDDWSARRCDEITPEMCRRKHGLLGATRGKPTADKSMKLLRRLYNWSRLTPNPAGGKQIDWFVGKHTDERLRYLGADEMKRYLDAVEHEPNQTLKDFLKVSLLVGQRRGAICAMKWADLDLAAGIWRIPQADAKSKRDTVIPLTVSAVSLLKARRELQELAQVQSDYVFPNRRVNPKKPHIDNPGLAHQRACKRAKITDLRLHDLRRTAGVWLAIGGAGESIIAAMLGHADRESVRRYSNVANLAIVRAAMEKAQQSMQAPEAKP
jgi:integrase